MNKKLTNYVNGLFSDYPKTKKAEELREEILSNLNEHYNDAIKNGYSENEAYTDAISKLGNTDELIQSIMPDKELSAKIDAYTSKRAKFIAIAVMLYIIGGACIIGIPGISVLANVGDIAIFGIIGLLVLLLFVAVATGMIIYINMSVPQDVSPYLIKDKDYDTSWIDTTTEKGKKVKMIVDILSVLTIPLYFIVSFTTGAWYCTWLIFLIVPVGCKIAKLFNL